MIYFNVTGDIYFKTYQETIQIALGMTCWSSETVVKRFTSFLCQQWMQWSFALKNASLEAITTTQHSTAKIEN